MGQYSNWSSVSKAISPRVAVRLTDYSYLFNPFTIATCIGRPTSLFANCAILYAIAKAVSGKPMSSVLALGLASYLSLYPALLLPPLILLCYDRQTRDAKAPSPISSFAVKHVLVFFAAAIWFLYISYILTGGSWEFLSSTYGVHLLLPDLTPNVGLWWYFFIEMFDSFREFFLGVFWLHLAGYVGGLSVRVRKQPLFIITALLGIFAIFKPYPSLSDTSLYFAMLPLYRHIFPRKSHFCTTAPLYAALLMPISNALHFLRHGHYPVCNASGPSVLLPLDIRRLRQRQLFLCHHSRLEPWPF